MTSNTELQHRRCRRDWPASIGVLVFLCSLGGCTTRPSNDCQRSWTCSATTLDGLAGGGGTSNFSGFFFAGAAGAAGSGGALSVVTGGMGGTGSATAGVTAGAAGTENPAGTAGRPSVLSQVTLSVDPILRVRNGSQQLMTLRMTRTGNDDRLVVRLSGLPQGVTSPGEVFVESGINQADLVVQDVQGLSRGGPYPIAITVASTADSSVRAQASVNLYLSREPGKVDLSFGATAMAVQRISEGGSDVPRDAIVDSSGRIVLAGSGRNAASSEQAWVVRLTKNAALDGEFDPQKKWSAFGNPPAVAHRLSMLGDRLYVGCTASGGSASFLRRYSGLATGSPDVTFADGTVPTACLPLADGLVVALGPVGALVALQPDGTQRADWKPPQNLGVAVVTTDAQGRVVYGQVRTDVFAFGRLTATGSRDLTFGTNGDLILASSGASPARLPSLVVTPAAQIVALVESTVGTGATNTEVRLYGITADGLADSSFCGTACPGSLRLASNKGRAYAAVAQPDGKLVVLYSEFDTAERYRLARYDYQNQGQRDATFADGQVVDLGTEFPGVTVRGMTYDPYAHRIVIYGSTAEGAAVMGVWL